MQPDSDARHQDAASACCGHETTLGQCSALSTSRLGCCAPLPLHSVHFKLRCLSGQRGPLSERPGLRSDSNRGEPRQMIFVRRRAWLSLKRQPELHYRGTFRQFGGAASVGVKSCLTVAAAAKWPRASSMAAANGSLLELLAARPPGPQGPSYRWRTVLVNWPGQALAARASQPPTGGTGTHPCDHQPDVSELPRSGFPMPACAHRPLQRTSFLL